MYDGDYNKKQIFYVFTNIYINQKLRWIIILLTDSTYWYKWHMMRINTRNFSRLLISTQVNLKLYTIIIMIYWNYIDKYFISWKLQYIWMLSFSFVSVDDYRQLLHIYWKIFLSPFSDRRLSRRLIRKLVDSHGSAETRSPLRRSPATLLMWVSLPSSSYLHDPRNSLLVVRDILKQILNIKIHKI